MDLRAIFGANVRRFRVREDLTQEELGKAVGATYQSILNYEKGKRWPQDVMVATLCKVLKVKPWQLFAEQGEGGAVPPDLVEHLVAAARAAGLKVSRGN